MSYFDNFPYQILLSQRHCSVAQLINMKPGKKNPRAERMGIKKVD